MDNRFEGRTMLVTGAASGFGAGIARRAAREGARVACVDINGEGAAAIAAEIGGGAVAQTADVSDGAQVKAAVARTLEAFGGLDIVVNNAGTSHRNQPLLDTREDEYDRVFAVNVKSLFHMVHAIVPWWRDRASGGVMINVTSTAGIRPRPGLTWYNASKAAANLMTRSLALELAGDRIRVCAVAPVMGESALLETFMGLPDTPENRAKFIATIPLGRMSTPADVAQAVLYLASDDAALMTGNVLEVDGGRTV
jgi:3-oxoacyl-[acyl-carrier protein] reductase